MDLSHNKLTHIPALSASAKNRMKSLVLCDNRISSLDGMEFCVILFLSSCFHLLDRINRIHVQIDMVYSDSSYPFMILMLWPVYPFILSMQCPHVSHYDIDVGPLVSFNNIHAMAGILFCSVNEVTPCIPL